MKVYHMNMDVDFILDQLDEDSIQIDSNSLQLHVNPSELKVDRLLYEFRIQDIQFITNKRDIVQNSNHTSNNVTDSHDHKQCQHCGNRNGKLYYCQCRMIRYCNHNCQHLDRESHRKDCLQVMNSKKMKNNLLKQLIIVNDMPKYVVDQPGLENIGNTCYMNCILQIVSQIPEIRDYYYQNKFIEQLNVNNEMGSKGELTIQFSNLVKELKSSSMSVDCWKFKSVLEKVAVQFEGDYQHDCQEFMNYLLDILHEDVKNKNESTIIDQTFGGQFMNIIECLNCGYESRVIEDYRMISLPIQQECYELTLYVILLESKKAQQVVIKSRQNCKMTRILSQIKQDMKLDDVQVYELLDSQINQKVGEDMDIEQMIALDGLIFIYEIPSDEQHCFYNVYDLKIELISYPRVIRTQSTNNKQQVKYQICKVLSQLDEDDIELYSIQQQDLVKIIDDEQLQTSIDQQCLAIMVESDQKQSVNFYRAVLYKQYNLKDEKCINIQDCLNQFQKPERIEEKKYKCDKCKLNVQIIKQMNVKKYGKYVVLHLKRFRNRGYGSKIDDMVAYNQSMTLGGQKYRLFGVAQHMGEIGYGHYTSIVKNQKHWLVYDDYRVSQTQNYETKYAYILVYQKV